MFLKFARLIKTMACFILLNNISILAAPHSDSLEKIRNLHLQAIEGNKKAVDQTVELLSPLIKKEPENPVYQVYMGSCLTLKARDAFWPPKKLDYAREGFQTMDQAVACAPKNQEVRFIRAMCGLNVPKFFKRLDKAIEDFNILIQFYEQGHKFHQDASMVYFYAAKAQIKNNNKNAAEELLKKSIQTGSQDKWSVKSERLLKNL